MEREEQGRNVQGNEEVERDGKRPRVKRETERKGKEEGDSGGRENGERGTC